jgi:hypothetical protein
MTDLLKDKEKEFLLTPKRDSRENNSPITPIPLFPSRLSMTFYEVQSLSTGEISPNERIIKINVGGMRFETYISTLLVEKNTFFQSMLSRKFRSEENGEYFIDRDPKWFQTILNFFRKRKVEIGHLKLFEIHEILDELEFYHIDPFLYKVNLIYAAKRIHPEFCECIENGLNNMKDYTYYDLSGKMDGNAGALILSNMLRSNTTITKLYLSNNGIGDSGVLYLVEALQHNTSISQLHLDSNSIGDQGAKALFNFLKDNKRITTLSIHSNFLGDAGALVIADCLKENTTLTTLYLSNNSISNKGALAIADALRVNSKLTHLYLFNQNNTFLDVQQILSVIKEQSKINPTIY